MLAFISESLALTTTDCTAPLSLSVTRAVAFFPVESCGRFHARVTRSVNWRLASEAIFFASAFFVAAASAACCAAEFLASSAASALA